MPGVRGFGDPDALTLSTGKSVFYQPDAQNPDGYTLPFHLDTKTTSAQAIPSTSHDWQVQHSAWNNGRMDNWLPAHRAADGKNGPCCMSYHERDDIPFQFALADAFTVCDSSFSSVLGPTWRRERRHLRPRGPALTARRHRRRVHRRPAHRRRLPRADDHRQPVDGRRLGVHRALRPHLVAALPRAVHRCHGAEHQRLAAAHLRRLHLGAAPARPHRDARPDAAHNAALLAQAQQEIANNPAPTLPGANQTVPVQQRGRDQQQSDAVR
jgi:hypothetical protein